MIDTLSYIDIGILVLLVLLSIKGIWQGVIRGLASLLGIVLGIFFASRFYNEVGEWFSQTIYDLNAPELNALVGFLIIIIAIWSLCLLIGECLFRLLKFTPLAVLDGGLGLIFGFMKAFLLLSIIVFGISQIGWLKHFSQNLESNSTLFPVMKKLAIEIMNLQQIQEIQDNLNGLGAQLHTESTDIVSDGVQEMQDSVNGAINDAKQELHKAIQNADKDTKTSQ